MRGTAVVRMRRARRVGTAVVGVVFGVIVVAILLISGKDSRSFVDVVTLLLPALVGMLLVLASTMSVGFTQRGSEGCRWGHLAADRSQRSPHGPVVRAGREGRAGAAARPAFPGPAPHP